MPASAPVAVCCPNCWKWTEVKNSSTCKRCGTPLVLPDGRRLDQARDGTAPAPAAIKAPTVSLAPLTVGTDWVSIARWISAAHGALYVLAIFAIALLVPSVNVSSIDPNTGQILVQTVNIRPALALLAFIVIVIYAVFVWLIKFGVVRALLLAVTVLVALATLGHLSSETSTTVAASLVDVLIAAGTSFVLIMSFVSPPRPAPLHPSPVAVTPAAQMLPMAAPPPPPPPPQLAPPQY
jgi:hypothetical protein